MTETEGKVPSKESSAQVSINCNTLCQAMLYFYVLIVGSPKPKTNKGILNLVD